MGVPKSPFPKLPLSTSLIPTRKFLVYGRWEDADLQEGLKVLLTQFDGDHPGLLGRIHVFGLLDHGGPRWREPATAASFKLLVKRILAIA